LPPTSWRDVAFQSQVGTGGRLTGYERDRLTNEITVLTANHLGEDIGSAHPVPYGHRGAPSQSALWQKPTSLDAAVAEQLQPIRRSLQLAHHSERLPPV